MKRLFSRYDDEHEIVAPARETNEKAFYEYLGRPEHEELMRFMPDDRPRAGPAFRSALAGHPYWGRFPAHFRPNSPAQMNDRTLMRRAEGWLVRQQIIIDANPNPRLLRIKDIPEHKRPPEYQTKCATCKGHGNIVTGRKRINANESRYIYSLCPDCELPARQQKKRKDMNKRWPLPALSPNILAREWFSNLPQSSNAIKKARQAQQEIIAEMPSKRTMFLYGVPGVGKSHLLAEIAIEARRQGLSAIFRTIENIRSIIQNFPVTNDEPYVKAEKQRRLSIASEDLKTCDVLVIDELDDAIGPSIRKTLLEILSHRMSNNLTTCFAANGDPHTTNYLTKPIKSRLFAAGNLTVNLLRAKDQRPYLGY